MALAASCMCASIGLHRRSCGIASARPCSLQLCAPAIRAVLVHASVATGPPGDDGTDDLTASFAKELQKRDMASAAAAEAEHASAFDGSALLQVIQDK